VKKSAPLVACLLFAVSAANAVILLDTGDPSVNTTAPAGALANSGWQYQGNWSGWLGTPISPNLFVSAAHLGQASDHITFQGVSYPIVQSFSLPGSDLLIWQVNGTFPYFAPLYTKKDEVGQHLVVIGCGTERGSEVMLNGTSRGWEWGADTDIRRWGENDVADIVPYGGHDLLYATFDQHMMFDQNGQPTDRPNECHLSRNDSGGGIFLNDNGTWKLAAISYAVDDLYTAPSTSAQFLAAIFDARDYYSYDGTNFTQITGATPVPTGFYGSRISSELAWICRVIADPQIGMEGNFLTLTYSRLIAPSTDIIYTVEQSEDLVSWSPATVEEDTISTSGDIEKIKAKIDIGTATHLFARLRVARP